MYAYSKSRHVWCLLPICKQCVYLLWEGIYSFIFKSGVLSSWMVINDTCTVFPYFYILHTKYVFNFCSQHWLRHHLLSICFHLDILIFLNMHDFNDSSSLKHWLIKLAFIVLVSLGAVMLVLQNTDLGTHLYLL
jgi:hypothetical protein